MTDKPTLPDGWVPLTITHEGQYPEEVAYGPQIMMDRLGKWLGKYFAQAEQADSVQEDAARYRLLRRGQHWSVIDGIGNELRAEALDAATDSARAAQKEEEKP